MAKLIFRVAGVTIVETHDPNMLHIPFKQFRLEDIWKVSTQCHNDRKGIKYRQGVEVNMPEDPHGNRQYATHEKIHTKSNINYTEGYVNWTR